MSQPLSHMAVFQADALYILARGPGANTTWNGLSWVDGVAGPVSADIAKRTCAMGGVRHFRFVNVNKVRWHRIGDTMQPFYETAAENLERVKALEADAARQADVQAKQRASRIEARAEAEGAEERKQLDAARALVEKHAVPILVEEAKVFKKREKAVAKREKALAKRENEIKSQEDVLQSIDEAQKAERKAIDKERAELDPTPTE